MLGERLSLEDLFKPHEQLNQTKTNREMIIPIQEDDPPMEKQNENPTSANSVEGISIPQDIMTILHKSQRTTVEAERLQDHFKLITFFDKLCKEAGQEMNELLLNEVWKNVELAELSQYSVIFKEKDPSNNKMYIVIHGKVGISVKLYATNNLNKPKPRVDNIAKSSQQLDQQNGSQKATNSAKQKSEKESEIPVPNRRQSILFPIKKQNSSDEESDKEDEEAEEEIFPEFGKKVVELSSGSAFGDQALFTEGGFRNASVYTLEDSIFLVIRRQKFLGVLRVIERLKQDKIQSIASAIPQFQDIVSKHIKDRLVYEFNEINLSKGALLTQEFQKGSNVYILLKGEVSLEKSVELQEYKEKESMEVKIVKIPRILNKCTAGELIGDEVLNEISSLYLSKKNMQPQEYKYTTKVTSRYALFLFISKKQILQKFPKHIVTEMRENCKRKIQFRQFLINDYINKVQSNFIENQKQEIKSRKSFQVKINSVKSSTSNDSPVNKMMQFQHLLRSSILPKQDVKEIKSYEQNENLLKELNLLKQKRENSIIFYGDSKDKNQMSSQRQSISQENTQQQQQQDQSQELLQFQSSQLNNLAQIRSLRQSFECSLSSQAQQQLQQSLSPMTRLSVNSPNFFNSKDKLAQSFTTFSNKNINRSSNLNSNANITSTTYINVNNNNNNYNPKLEFSQTNNNNNYNVSQQANLKINNKQNSAYLLVPNHNNNDHFSMDELAKLEFSVPAMGTTITTTFNNNSNTSQNVTRTSMLYPQNIQLDVQQSTINDQKVQKKKEIIQKNQIINNNNSRLSFFYDCPKETKKKQELETRQKKQMIEQQQQFNMENKARIQLNKSILPEEKLNQLKQYKQQQSSQIYKKIDCDVMKKEIIFQHMNSLHKFKQINPFENVNNNKSLKIQKRLQQITNQHPNTSSQSLNQSPNKSIKNFSFKKEINSNDQVSEKNLLPIQENAQEEIGSKRKIEFKITQEPKSLHSKSKLSSADIRNVNKSQVIQSARNLVVDKDVYEQGHEKQQKKKIYLLQDTWDMGIENLRLKELDLRNGLFRKGIIQKDPNFTTKNHDFGDKFDEYYCRAFQKYLHKKQINQNEEALQLSGLIQVESVSRQASPLSQIPSQTKRVSTQTCSRATLSLRQNLENEITKKYVLSDKVKKFTQYNMFRRPHLKIGHSNTFHQSHNPQQVKESSASVHSSNGSSQYYQPENFKYLMPMHLKSPRNDVSTLEEAISFSSIQAQSADFQLNQVSQSDRERGSIYHSMNNQNNQQKQNSSVPSQNRSMIFDSASTKMRR